MIRLIRLIRFPGVVTGSLTLHFLYSLETPVLELLEPLDQLRRLEPFGVHRQVALRRLTRFASRLWLRRIVPPSRLISAIACRLRVQSAPTVQVHLRRPASVTCPCHFFVTRLANCHSLPTVFDVCVRPTIATTSTLRLRVNRYEYGVAGAMITGT